MGEVPSPLKHQQHDLFNQRASIWYWNLPSDCIAAYYSSISETAPSSCEDQERVPGRAPWYHFYYAIKNPDRDLSCAASVSRALSVQVRPAA